MNISQEGKFKWVELREKVCVLANTKISYTRWVKVTSISQFWRLGSLRSRVRHICYLVKAGFLLSHFEEQKLFWSAFVRALIAYVELWNLYFVSMSNTFLSDFEFIVFKLGGNYLRNYTMLRWHIAKSCNTKTDHYFLKKETSKGSVSFSLYGDD